MPRPKREPITKNGRPKIEFDWDFVDELLEGGCIGTEIAACFGVTPETFYDRCIREKGMGFSQYSSEKKPKGEALIRLAQYKKAIGESDKGDSQLLMFLGKARLMQRETSEVSVPTETLKAFVGVMSQISLVHEGKAKASESLKPTEDQKQSFTSNFNP